MITARGGGIARDILSAPETAASSRGVCRRSPVRRGTSASRLLKCLDGRVCGRLLAGEDGQDPYEVVVILGEVIA
jgi:hypothetical protein